MSWDGILVGPFFFEGSVTGESYLKMLGDEMMPQLDALGRKQAGSNKTELPLTLPSKFDIG